MKLLLVVSFLLVGLAALIGWTAFSQAEPLYQGRPLTSWVEQWETNHWVLDGSTYETRKYENKKAEQEAADAAHRTGNDGIRFLLGLLNARDPAIKLWLRDKVPPSWHSRLRLGRPAERLNKLGAYGLASLGTNASLAIPELLILLSSEMGRNLKERNNAYMPDWNHGYLPVWVLGKLGRAAEPAVPLLVQCLTNSSPQIRIEASEQLGNIGCRPEIVVPALFDYLKTPHSDVVGWEGAATGSLLLFGTNSFPIVPTLVAMLDDPNPRARRVGTNLLPIFDRSAAERAKIDWRSIHIE